MVYIQFWSDNVVMNLTMLVSIILFGFLLFLFLTFVASRVLYKEKKFKEFHPPLSILIPCYNEEKNIGNCLKSISDSSYDLKKLEVIVIDDGSTDNTREQVDEFIEKNSLSVRVVRGGHRGKSQALNLGLTKAKNDLIMSVDADIVLQKDTISKLVTPLSEKNVAATNAVAYIRNPKTFLEHFQMIEFTLNNFIRTSFSRVFNNSIWFFGAVAVYRKSALSQVGNFKTDTLTEDMDICLELYNKGHRIVTVSDAVISTVAMPSLSMLFKQRMRWYYGALQSLFKNRQLLKEHRRSPPVLFLFFNQYWWTFFAFVFFPMTIYHIYFWWPSTSAEVGSYLFRWFSLSGPFYVLYKIPEWGINFINIFGVLSGIITFMMSLFSLYLFKGKWSLKTLVCLFFYFPYTIVQDAIIVSGVLKYIKSKRKYFIG